MQMDSPGQGLAQNAVAGHVTSVMGTWEGAERKTHQQCNGWICQVKNKLNLEEAV